MKDISKISYADAGVSIADQNEVNSRIKRILKSNGLFGGAVNISSLKDNESVPIGISSSLLKTRDTHYQAGFDTADMGLKELSKVGLIPLAMLDYIAGPDMDKNNIPDFVKGVAQAGLNREVLTMGGESAEMPGTYKPGQWDAYVHNIFYGDFNQTVEISHLIKNMKKPLLCGTTDGTGTKTRWVKNPMDIIFHGSNDLGAMGVEPIGFALYVAGNVDMKILENIAKQSEKICEDMGIASLDTALYKTHHVYEEGQVDIAGTVIGVVDEENMITGDNVKPDDVLIGFSADGLMTNGYSLAREIVQTMKDNNQINKRLDAYIKKELSRPHVLYTDILFGYGKTKGILEMFPGSINATAHITGGGQKDNIERMVPDGMTAAVTRNVLPLPSIVNFFANNGATIDNLTEALNMGVGFSITAPYDVAKDIINYSNKNFANRFNVDRTAAEIGKIEVSKNKEKFYFVN